MVDPLVMSDKALMKSIRCLKKHLDYLRDKKSHIDTLASKISKDILHNEKNLKLAAAELNYRLRNKE